jgi:hypothetical protein
MGRDKHEKDRHKGRLPPFVPLLIDTLDRPAWRAMSHGAQMLYVALRRRYNRNLHNNGRLFLSQRMAAKELNSHHTQVARWFRELQHYGFIVLQKPGFLGVEGRGQAPRWRLTELGYMNDPPTREYERWDGTPFKTKPRAGKATRSVRVFPHSSVRENHPLNVPSVPENPHKESGLGVQENQHKSSLPLSVSPAVPVGFREPPIDIPAFLPARRRGCNLGARPADAAQAAPRRT